ncbi:MAG: hypothetical protein COB39_10895 [Marinosulfonomonas sp.]|nr:MAG: hypothetical protein COB39_10895 [Marinosulfonomonas sp.]
MGRSRGGLTTKIHALINEDGLPLRYLLTPGQVVLADKAYDADWIREMIWEQGAKAVIPSKSNRKLPKEFDKALYKTEIKSRGLWEDQTLIPPDRHKIRQNFPQFHGIHQPGHVQTMVPVL